MMQYAAKAPTIPIPFNKLLKVVALVDEKDSQVRALLERLTAENYEVEVSGRYDRDVSEDAAVGAYVVAVDGEGVTVVCADGRFKVTRVQPADGKKIEAGEWAKSANLTAGKILG